MTRAQCATEVDALLDWLERRDFTGHDPFDGLESRVFQATPLARSALARLAWIQLFKRSPLNLRRPTLVPAARNPKTVGLVLTALARLSRVRRMHSEAPVEDLVAWLARSRSPGSAGWGYPFAWQNRAFYAPRHTPNAVCTVFVVQGLMEYAAAAQAPAARALALSALPFFVDELRRTGSDSACCFSYTPLDESRIHNVNLLVAGTLARLAAEPEMERSAELAGLARAGFRYSIAQQRSDGAWSYGEGAAQAWVDSFHTGFNLGALRQGERWLDMDEARMARERGYRYFRARLLDAEGRPKYYDTRQYPIDVHACAQAVITLIDNADLASDAMERAAAVAAWTRRVLGRGSGRYMYQRGRLIKKPMVYARWGQAWMLRALSELECAWDPTA